MKLLSLSCILIRLRLDCDAWTNHCRCVAPHKNINQTNDRNLLYTICITWHFKYWKKSGDEIGSRESHTFDSISTCTCLAYLVTLWTFQLLYQVDLSPSHYMTSNPAHFESVDWMCRLRAGVYSAVLGFSLAVIRLITVCSKVLCFQGNESVAHSSIFCFLWDLFSSGFRIFPVMLQASMNVVMFLLPSLAVATFEGAL